MSYPPRRHTVKFEGHMPSVVVSSGTTLLEAARRAGLELGSTCSGQCFCGECLVVVLEGQVSALDADEEDMLTPAQIDAGLRLACCTRVHSPVVVRLANEDVASPP